MGLPEQDITSITESSFKKCYDVHTRHPELLAMGHAFCENCRAVRFKQTTRTQIEFHCPNKSCSYNFHVNLTFPNGYNQPSAVREVVLQDHTCPEVADRNTPNVIGNKFFWLQCTAFVQNRVALTMITEGPL